MKSKKHFYLPKITVMKELETLSKDIEKLDHATSCMNKLSAANRNLINLIDKVKYADESRKEIEQKFVNIQKTIIKKLESDLKESIEKLGFVETPLVGSTFTKSDIQDQAIEDHDQPLTEKQLNDVISFINSKVDCCNVGVNWNTISFAINQVLNS